MLARAALAVRQEQEATVGTVAIVRGRKTNTNVKFTIQRRTPDSLTVP